MEVECVLSCQTAARQIKMLRLCIEGIDDELAKEATSEARRIENRLAGMDCNPYLCIAASLACGYLGLMNEIRPDKRYQGDAYDAEDDIPKGLFAALDLFDEATEMHAALGPEFARVYSIVKRAEYDEFLQVISPWEREHLLLNV